MEIFYRKKYIKYKSKYTNILKSNPDLYLDLDLKGGDNLTNIKPIKPIKPIKVITQTIDVRIDLTKTYMKSNYFFPEDDEWNGIVDVKTIIQ